MIALLIAAGVFGVWYWWTHRTTAATSATSGSGDIVGSLISSDGSVSGNGVTITADDGTATPVLPSDVTPATPTVPSDWSPSTGVNNNTIVESPSKSAQAAAVNGTLQTVITPNVIPQVLHNCRTPVTVRERKLSIPAVSELTSLIKSSTVK